MTLREPLDAPAVLSDFCAVENGQPGAAMTDEEKRARDRARKKAKKQQKFATDPEGYVMDRARSGTRAKAWCATNKNRRAEIQQKYRSAHAPEIKTRWQARYAALSDAERLWEAARKRAVAKGIDFNLSKSDIVIPRACPVLGTVLERAKGTSRANSPSLDRIDNTKGYVPGNVQVISNRANSIKRDATIEELESLVAHLKSLRDRAVRLDESGNRT